MTDSGGRNVVRRVRWLAVWKQLRLLLLLVVGSLLAALSFSLFQVPYNLAAGGVTGIGIIIQHLTGFSASLFYFIANVPLLILGAFTLGGWRFLYKTIIAVVTFTIFTEYFSTVLPTSMQQWPMTDNMLLSAIYAGLVGGIGGGLIFGAGGTLGGTAIIGRIIQDRTGMPLSQIYLFVDGAIVVTAGLVFGWESALYAYLTLLLSGLATDYVLEGPSRTRTATIITTQPEAMIAAILAELGRGVSYWEVYGGYTRETRTVVLCTIYRQQLAELKRVVSEVDSNAFVTIGMTQEAMGKGFIDLRHSVG